ASRGLNVAHAVQGAGAHSMELGRALYRRHNWLQRGEIEDRYHLQRPSKRDRAVRDPRLARPRRRDRRRPSRLQLARRHVACRHRMGSQLLRPARKAQRRVPRRDLQSPPHRRHRRSLGDCQLRGRPEARMGRDAARAPRVGVTVPPDDIAYLTGGLAVGEVMTAGTVFGFDGFGNPVNTIVSSHNTQGGWTVGGGIEGRVAGNWTTKIEYLHLDLGTVTTIPAPTPGSTTAVGFNSRITENIVRVGANYKFDATDIWTND